MFRLLSIPVAFACLAGFAQNPVITHAYKAKSHQVHGIAPNKLSAKQAIAKLEAERDPFWLRAKMEVYRNSKDVAAQATEEAVGGLRYRRLLRNPNPGKTIALTFDDGPHPDYTPKILQILKRYGVKATFFVVGSQAEMNPKLVNAELGAGHVVGNHTYHHVSLTKIPLAYAEEEIKACGDVLKAVTGRAPRFFRPPGGDYNRDVAAAANRLGYTMVLWTDDPGDYARLPEARIIAKTLSRVAPGGIILLHDGVQATVDALPEVIENLQRQGYRFVTPEDMVRRENGSAAASWHARMRG